MKGLWDGHSPRKSQEEVESNASESDKEPDAEEEPVRSVVLVMLAMVLGYASTIGPLQHEFKVALGIGQADETAHLFTLYAGFAHIGKFVGYIGHSVVFACLAPLARVYVSMAFMFMGIMVPSVFVFLLKVHWLGMVPIAYTLTGFGFGVFEVTFLNVITPLGKKTKAWAITGFPLGFAMINVICPLCSYFGIKTKFLFWCILAFIPLGLFFLTKLPIKSHAVGSHHKGAQQSLWESLLEGRSWLPGMVPQLLGRFVVESVMQNNPNYYIYNDPKLVPLWSPKSTDAGLVDVHLFFTVFGTAVFLGDAISRRISFLLPLDTLKWNVILLAGATACSLVAFGLMSFDIAALAVVAIFLAFWGNGLMYGAGAKFIDRFVPSSNNLAAYSLWSFAGGIGSILGAEAIDVVHDLYCGGRTYPHVCRTSN